MAQAAKDPIISIEPPVQIEEEESKIEKEIGQHCFRVFEVKFYSVLKAPGAFMGGLVYRTKREDELVEEEKKGMILVIDKYQDKFTAILRVKS